MIAFWVIGGAVIGFVLDALARFVVRLAGYGDRAPRITDHARSQLRILVALLAALGFGWIAWRSSGAEAVLLAAAFGYLLLLTVIDLQYRLVLNMLVYPAVAVALLANVVLLGQPPLTVLLGGAFAFGIFFATALVRPGELGGGDVKLALLIGLALGFPDVLFALLSGALAGAVVALWLRFGQNRAWGSTIPYAPFLCAGAGMVLLLAPG